MGNETFFIGENKTPLLLLRFAQPEHSSPSPIPGLSHNHPI
jgi:hypothetical protein